MERLKRLLNEVNPQRILDLATGSGQFVELLVSMLSEFDTIIGIDQSSKAIDLANKSNTNSKVSFQQMDIENLTFPKYSFDAVSLSNSLHHMRDIDAVITIMTEMLVPNGILVFNEMYSGSLNQQQVTHTLIHHFIAEIDCINNLIHNETLSYKEVIKTIKSHSKIGEVDIWKLEIKDQKPLNKEACNNLKETLAKVLKSIESHKDYLKFEARALQLEKRLDTIGFLSAPQMIVVAKVMTY